MLRLDKIYNIFCHLEDDYLKKVSQSKYANLTRYDYLKLITQYTGSVNDEDKFRSIFSSEIGKYTSDDLEHLDVLLSKYRDIIEIIKQIEETGCVYAIDDIDVFINDFSSVLDAEDNFRKYSLDSFSVYRTNYYTMSQKHFVSSIYYSDNTMISKQISPFGESYAYIINKNSLLYYLRNFYGRDLDIDKIMNAIIVDSLPKIKKQYNIANRTICVASLDSVRYDGEIYFANKKIDLTKVKRIRYKNKKLKDLFGKEFTLTSDLYYFTLDTDHGKYLVVLYGAVS